MTGFLPARTWALIIGVERYAGFNTLKGPADDAVHFAAWLLGRGVPPGQIRLFLSPRENGFDTPVPLPYRPATAPEIHADLLDNYRTAGGDLFLFYFSGHGVVRNYTRRALVCADADQGKVASLDFDSLLNCFASDYIAAFPTQAFIVDACATHFSSPALTDKLVAYTFPSGHPAGREVFQLLASEIGGTAQTLEGLSTSLFSRELLALLKAKGESAWPPDLDGVSLELVDRFDALRAGGEWEQIPEFVHLRPWAGIAREFTGPTASEGKFRARLTGLSHTYESVFRRADLNYFTGRAWMVNQIDCFLAGNESGVIRIEANAGLGKSALLAHLAATRKWVHHFVEVAPGADGIQFGIDSLARQIIGHCDLRMYWELDTWQAAAANPAFLGEILAAAAPARNALRPKQPVVIVVDGLDESAEGRNGNVMGLPDTLPQGVFLLVAHRPVPITLHVRDVPHLTLSIDAAHQDNRQDIRDYLDAVALRPNVAKLIAGSGLSRGRFTEVLLHKSEGVWIYLKYLVSEIDTNKPHKHRPLNLDRLPVGLWRYYYEFWSDKASEPDWAALQLPVIRTLTSLQEDVTLPQLCRFAGLPQEQSDAAKHLLHQVWRPYLVLSQRSETRYRVYHASLRDFIAGSVDRAAFTNLEIDFIDDLAKATRDAHGRIADYYLQIWDGFDAGLIGLSDDNRRNADSGYGMRHVLTHLEAAGRLVDARRVLTTEWTRVHERTVQRRGWRGWVDKGLAMIGRPRIVYDTEFTNAWYKAHALNADIASYRTGLNRCWAAASATSEQLLREGNLPESLILEIRCIVMLSSLTGLADNIGPRLLRRLVELNLMPLAEANAYAQQVSNPGVRIRTLIELAHAAGEPQRTDILRQVLTLVPVVFTREPFSPMHASAVSRELPAWFQRDFITAVMEATRSSSWGMPAPLAGLARRVSDDVLLHLVIETWRLGPGDNPVAVLAVAAQRLNHDELLKACPRVMSSVPPSFNTPMVERVLGKFRPENESGYRSTYVPKDDWAVIEALWPALSEEERNSARSRAVAAVQHDSHRWDEVMPLLEKADIDALLGSSSPTPDKLSHHERTGPAAARLAALGHHEAAWDLIASLDPHYSSTAPLAAQAIELLPTGYVEKALDWILRSDWITWRAVALEGVVPRLLRAQVERVQASLSGIGDRWTVQNTLAKLAPHLIRHSDRPKVIEWAKEAPFAGEALAQLAPQLTPEERADLRKRIRRMPPEHRARALLGFASAEPDPQGRVSILEQALTAISSVDYANARLELLVDACLLSTGKLQSTVLDNCVDEIEASGSAISLYGRCVALKRLMPHAHEPALRRILTAGSHIPEEWGLRDIAAAAAPVIPEFRLRQVLLDPPADRNSRTKVIADLLSALGCPAPSERATRLLSLRERLHPSARDTITRAVDDILNGAAPPQSLQEALAVLEVDGVAHETIRLLSSMQAPQRAAAETQVKALLQASTSLAGIEAQIFPFDVLRSQDPAGGYAIAALKQHNGMLPDDVADILIGRERNTHEILPLVSKFPDRLLPNLLARIIAEDKTQERFDNLRQLATRLAARDTGPYPILQRSLKSIAGGPRNTICSDLVALAPLIEKAGGPKAIPGLFESIESAQRWWP